jgi:hypothetical protein
MISMASTETAFPSHGRGPRFDPLCVHQKPLDLLGFSRSDGNPNRQLDTERSAKRATRPVDFAWTLFAGCSERAGE